jgi:hypothetical protein
MIHSIAIKEVDMFRRRPFIFRRRMMMRRRWMWGPGCLVWLLPVLLLVMLLAVRF